MLYKTKLWISVITGVAVVGGAIYCFALKPKQSKDKKSKAIDTEPASEEDNDEDLGSTLDSDISTTNLMNMSHFFNI